MFLLLLGRISVEASVLLLLIIVLQKVFHRALPVLWRHGLWFLVVVRLLLPVPPQSEWSIFNWLKLHTPETDNAVYVEAQPLQIKDTVPGAARYAAPLVRKKVVWPRVLFTVWGTGTVVLLLNILFQQLRLRYFIGRQRQLTDSQILNLLEDCKGQMGITTPITVVAAEGIDSPALFGFVRPRILLPGKILKSLSVEELRFVLLHELAHVKRWDVAMNWMATILQIVHWFNPLLWWGFMRMRADREQACDAMVLSHTGEEESTAYGHTIIKLLESYSRPAFLPSMTGILEDKRAMRKRITMIAGFKRVGPLSAVGLFSVLILGLVGLTGASGTRPSTPTNKYIFVKSLQEPLDAEMEEANREFYFSGNKDFVSLGTEVGNFGTGDFAVEFWIKTVTTLKPCIMSKRQICNSGSFWDLDLLYTGEIRFELGHDHSPANFHHLDTKSKVADGKYHHVIFTRQGTSFYVYVDGELDNVLQTPMVMNFANTGHLMLARTICMGISGEPYFGGQLKNVALYNRVLSGSEVQGNFVSAQ